MSKIPNHYLRFMPFGVFLFVVAALSALLMQPKESIVPAAKQLPVFSLAGLSAKEARFTNADITRPSLIHVAASWCMSCKADYPALQKLHADGVPVYGVMWNDKPDAARAMLKRIGNAYTKTAMDDGRFAIDIGLTGTPETLVVDASGKILLHVRGPLTDEVLESEILPRVR